MFALPGVARQENLDAKWINVVPALGVALAFVLSRRAAAVRLLWFRQSA